MLLVGPGLLLGLTETATGSHSPCLPLPYLNGLRVLEDEEKGKVLRRIFSSGMYLLKICYYPPPSLKSEGKQEEEG